MDLDSIANEVADQYPAALEHRKIGLELEYPVVFEDGAGVSFSVIAALFEELGKREWQLEYDRDTQAVISAERPPSAASSDFGGDVLTVEFGAHTLEIVLAPTDDVVEAETSLEHILAVVIPILRDHGAFLIGHGVQPLTPPSSHNVAPRGRYHLLEKSWNGSAADRYDIFLLTLSASSQTHVDVTRNEVIPVVNALNLTAGLRIALFANSGVWQGRVGDYAASRELFWDWCYSTRKAQIGIPAMFSSIGDYVERVLDFRSLLVRRGGAVFQADSQMTVGQFLTNETNQVRNTQGDSLLLTPAPEDISAQWGLAWFDARMQPMYGTVEERCACQQPPSAPMAPAALTLGLVENLAGLRDVADALTGEQWRELREFACRDGMRISHPDADVPLLIKQLVDAAYAGLVSRQRGEEKFLEPLYERVRLRRHPGADAEQLFLAGGAAAIVHNNNMARFLDR